MIKKKNRLFARFRLVFRGCRLAARTFMVMRKNAAASVPSPHKPEQQTQPPRKKLSFREPEVVPHGKPRVFLDRADEFELDDELQVSHERQLIIIIIIITTTTMWAS